MQLTVYPHIEAASLRAAHFIAEQLREKPDTVLGLATGSSPIIMYRELIRLHREEDLDFSQVTTFNLDEYCGLGPDHTASYHAFMFEHLFNHVSIPRTHIHILDGLADDVEAHCAAYENAIRQAGGIDLQVLGVGVNGHIGFNEPGAPPTSRTRVTALTPQTRSDNALFFDKDEYVPQHAITMGLGTIMDCRACLFLAFGERKAPAVAAMIDGPITDKVPASILQQHPRVNVFLDVAAAAQLTQPHS